MRVASPRKHSVAAVGGGAAPPQLFLLQARSLHGQPEPRLGPVGVHSPRRAQQPVGPPALQVPGEALSELSSALSPSGRERCRESSAGQAMAPLELAFWGERTHRA